MSMSKYKPIFGKTEYESDNGMITSAWGSCAWLFLHTISFNYPVNPTNENKKDYFNFIVNLTKVLPCGKCRDNLKTNL
jgi:hypothetical protein